MIKKTLILVIFIFFIVVFLSFFKKESFLINKVKELTEMPREKVEDFLEKKKENIVEEIDVEKENIKDSLREKGIDLWEDIGNSIFKKETDVDNEG